MVLFYRRRRVRQGPMGDVAPNEASYGLLNNEAGTYDQPDDELRRKSTDSDADKEGGVSYRRMKSDGS